LDEKDKKIISLLEENPDLSQSEIAAQVGISQPSVGVRLRKLKEKGALSFLIGMNFKKIDLFLVNVEMTAENSTEILKKFRGCPYFLNGFVVSGKRNLSLFFVSEDLTTIDSLVDAHLRNREDVKDVEVNIVITSYKDLIFPVRMKMEKSDSPPCGSKGSCGECRYYQIGHCLGCPVTGHYRGKFW
jgi:DNA-binding Lrp family transcriptional regulator